MRAVVVVGAAACLVGCLVACKPHRVRLYSYPLPEPPAEVAIPLVVMAGAEAQNEEETGRNGTGDMGDTADTALP